MSFILVVDDDVDLRETLQLLLAESGHRVEAVSNGRAALEVLAGPTKPDVMLLDLMMPEMNGWELLAKIEQDPAMASVPVIIMTARPATEPGLPHARKVLFKPFEFSELFSTLAGDAGPVR